MQISIKGARAEKGMTQKEVGIIMGVTPETISNWERGITAPSAPQLIKLCGVYGVNLSDIYLDKKLAKSQKQKVKDEGKEVA